MGFDINKFAEVFKNTIDWMLRDRHTKEIKDDLQFFKTYRNSLEENTNSPEALYEIIELIATKGYRLKRNDDFYKKLDNFIDKYGENFRSNEAREKIIELVGTKATKNVNDLLNYETIKEFTENLYRSAKKGETFVLGEKGRDEYLRDFGYWDRIPMDQHEMRFIIRTGIYHICSVDDQSDPLEKSHLHDALTRFCNSYLKGYVVEEIDLGEAPGIVDIFIWSFSAEDRYKMCGATPKCEECNLKGVCLYALTNSP